MSDFWRLILDWLSESNGTNGGFLITGVIAVVFSTVISFLIDPLKEQFAIQRDEKRVKSISTRDTFVLKINALKLETTRYRINLEIKNVSNRIRIVEIESNLSGPTDSGNRYHMKIKTYFIGTIEIAPNSMEKFMIGHVSVSPSRLEEISCSIKVSPKDWGEAFEDTKEVRYF